MSVVLDGILTALVYSGGPDALGDLEKQESHNSLCQRAPRAALIIQRLPL